jgi:hypothetical protein
MDTTDQQRARVRTSVSAAPGTQMSLRHMARDLGYIVVRGTGAGELGNVGRLLDDLAAAYRRDPERTVGTMRDLLSSSLEPA